MTDEDAAGGGVQHEMPAVPVGAAVKLPPMKGITRGVRIAGQVASAADRPPRLALSPPADGLLPIAAAGFTRAGVVLHLGIPCQPARVIAAGIRKQVPSPPGSKPVPRREASAAKRCGGRSLFTSARVFVMTRVPEEAAGLSVERVFAKLLRLAMVVEAVLSHLAGNGRTRRP